MITQKLEEVEDTLVLMLPSLINMRESEQIRGLMVWGKALCGSVSASLEGSSSADRASKYLAWMKGGVMAVG